MRDRRWQELTDDECRKLLVADAAGLERLRVLPLCPWAPGAKARYDRIRPVSVTGRRIALPADLPFTWWG